MPMCPYLSSSWPPSVQTFKEVFSKEKSGGQQDVSEFTHKLLEWIEEAFSHTLTATGDSEYVSITHTHTRPHS